MEFYLLEMILLIFGEKVKIFKILGYGVMLIKDSVCLKEVLRICVCSMGKGVQDIQYLEVVWDYVFVDF